MKWENLRKTHNTSSTYHGIEDQVNSIICRSLILSLVQFLFFLVLYLLSYIIKQKNNEKEKLNQGKKN